MGKQVTLDTVPFNKYHLKLIAYCSGCTLVAGYVIGVVAISLDVMQKQIQMSTLMSGLIGMGTLLGMVFGSLFGGQLTDLLGRKRMYVVDFTYLTIMSVLQFFVSVPWQAFVLRVLLGIGLGPAYSIAGPYLAELAPQKSRGNVVGMLNALWFIGYALSYVVCYLLLPIGASSWRWMLLSSAGLTLVWLIGIRHMPESPRWLINHGRQAEVPAILKQIGPQVVLPKQTVNTDRVPQASFKAIFTGGYGKSFFFVAVFWSLQIIPVFGIGTYLPTIMAQLGLAGNLKYLGSAVVNCLYLLGLIPIFIYLDRAGHRPTLIASFLVRSVALVILTVTAKINLPFALVLCLFVLFGACNAAGGAHQYVYPNELFPTEIRATAVGAVTSFTRILSAVSTFLTPIILNHLGLQAMLAICAGVSILGTVISIIMAPETKDLNLNEAAHLNQKMSAVSSPTVRKKEQIVNHG